VRRASLNRRRATALALAAAALGAGAAPAVASASCGGVVTAKPTKRVNPKGRAPIAIGDSIMILAVRRLAAEGYHANAQGCRQWDQGVEMLRRKGRRNSLPHLVTMALGTNGPVTGAQVADALKALPKNRVLALVTPRGKVSGNGAALMRAFAARHRHRVVLLDWARYSAGHNGWFQPDGLHLTLTGAAAYARLLGKAIPFARNGRFPNGAVFPR
jgi:hypothetical protein